MSTTARVLIGLALGILAGILSTLAGDDFAARLAALVSPVGTLWLNALRMTVVPLVVSLVIVGVADASNAAGVRDVIARFSLLCVMVLTGCAADPPAEVERPGSGDGAGSGSRGAALPGRDAAGRPLRGRRA